MRRSALPLFSVLLMLAGICSVLLLCAGLLDQGRIELSRRTDAEIRHVTAQVQAGLVSAVEPLEKLAEWWLTQGKPADEEDWRTDGELFLTRSHRIADRLLD